FFNPDGTPVPYFKDGRPFLDVYPGSIEFLTDLGPFTFAIILILNGLVLLLVRKPAAVAVMFVLALGVTLYNLGFLLWSFNTYGFAPISFLAAAFGALLCYYQWNLLRILRARRGG